MLVKSVSLKRFKCFEKESFEFFPGINFIRGKNGAGKSAIKDAIVFALYNRTINGSNQNVDTLIKRGEVSSSVEVVTVGGTFQRRRSDRASKLSFFDGSQSSEDSIVAQRDVDGTVIPFPEDFLAVFSPGYFMELPMEERREYVKKFLKPVDRMAIFESLGGTKHSLTVFGLDLNDLEECLKISREEKRLAEKEKELSENTISYLRKSLQEAGVTQSREYLLDEMKEIFEKIELRKAWDDYFTKKASVAPFEKALAEKRLQLEETVKALEGRGDLIPPSREVVDRLEKAMQDARVHHSLPDAIECPTCFQSIPEEHRERIRAVSITEKEKHDAIENEYHKELEEYIEATKVFNKEVNERLRLKTVIDTLKKELELSAIPTIIPPSQHQPVETLEVLTSRDKFLDKAIHQLDEMSSFEEKAAEAREQLLAADLLVNIFKATGLPSLELEEQIAPLNEALNAAIPGARFVLLKATKNGMEFKNVFDIEVNERPYVRLSSGEKKLVDVSLSIIFNSLLKEPGIIFIDDADLVDAGGIRALLEMTKGMQVFVTQVAEEEKITITNA